MPPQPQNPSDRKWSAKAEELEFNALENVKSSADKWATSIASLTGIFGIVALVKGPEDISELTVIFKWAVGIALLAALVSAFASTYLAALAAQGIPNSMWLTGSSIRRETGAATKRSVNRLHLSRLLVIPAVIALTTAIGLTWFGQRQQNQDETTTVLVVQQSGNVVCGEMILDKDGRLALKDRESITLLNQVNSIDIINKCP